MKKLIIFATLVVIIFITFSCDTVMNNRDENTSKIESPPDQLGGTILNYGNGVFYFNYTGNSFASNLSTFIEQHPELELVSFTGNGTGNYGHDEGYFVIFKKINK